MRRVVILLLSTVVLQADSPSSLQAQAASTGRIVGRVVLAP